MAGCEKLAWSLGQAQIPPKEATNILEVTNFLKRLHGDEKITVSVGKVSFFSNHFLNYHCIENLLFIDKAALLYLTETLYYIRTLI